MPSGPGDGVSNKGALCLIDTVSTLYEMPHSCKCVGMHTGSHNTQRVLTDIVIIQNRHLALSQPVCTSPDNAATSKAKQTRDQIKQQQKQRQMFLNILCCQ